jgi:hypothetical protein
MEISISPRVRAQTPNDAEQIEVELRAVMKIQAYAKGKFARQKGKEDAAAKERKRLKAEVRAATLRPSHVRATTWRSNAQDNA